MDKDRFRPWFKRHSYNHTLYPATPEGWITVLVWLLILVGSTMVLMAALIHASPGRIAILFALWALVIVIDTAALLYIRHIKSQRSYWREWRWRRSVKDNQN